MLCQKHVLFNSFLLISFWFCLFWFVCCFFLGGGGGQKIANLCSKEAEYGH